MESPSSSPNPRRRQINVAPPSLSSGLAFQKGATFHCPKSSRSHQDDPILHISSLPQRSSTCTSDLEAVLAAGVNRISSILGAIDRSFSSLESFGSDSQDTIIAEPEPVPHFMVEAIQHEVREDGMDLDVPTVRHRHHTSDSGIGSTETSAASILDKTAPAGTTQVQSGINGNSSITPPLGSVTQQVLSEYACRQVQKHIILPILREKHLKPFHALVSGLPYRVARKEITCLRDLEKVILWLAPKWSTSRKSFLQFCETSIQCLHTTVEHLSGSDLTRPNDRPYTNGYFLDLVEQVRQYAAIMAAERARMAPGECASPSNKTERLVLVGGLSQTGKPAELVRTVNGKTVSLRTGEEVDMDEYRTGAKRSSAEDLDDDLERSMARRKKNAVPIIQSCADCGKEFKRPCDLTKHEKTHSRPWKCNENGCKYYTYGWPTEKERDRHVNDKHSAAPKMYRCNYTPCPYESKRESNCKQHMEKAHGYAYVRAKNNGKVQAPSTVGAPTTPQMSTPGSLAFSAPTPDFSDNQSMIESVDDNNFDMSGMPTMRYMQEASNYAEIFGPVGNDFDFSEPPFVYQEAGSMDHRPSYASTSLSPADGQTTMDFEPDSIFGTTFDWSHSDLDINNFNAQMATPALSNGNALNSSAPSVNQSPPSTCLSPYGLGDAMLYSPITHVNQDFHDEGFSDFSQNVIVRPMHDFQIYSNPNSSNTITPSVEMFGSLPGFEKNTQEMNSQLTFFADIM